MKKLKQKLLMTALKNNDVKMLSRSFTELARRLILDAVDGEPYERELKTIEDKENFLRECFEAEYGYEVRRVGYIEAAKGYLQGLPTICTLPFYNSEMLEVLKTEGWEFIEDCEAFAIEALWIAYGMALIDVMYSNEIKPV